MQMYEKEWEFEKMAPVLWKNDLSGYAGFRLFCPTR